ncbi:hypothetical protein [Arcobacter ellisii]|uniref:hypothetical protein n=1 Tax=Arcobacter ellisii TaxID=913109 RepID=UPI00100AB383|nr:hypothetical protein [Arcobacter ellisii]
MQIIDLIILLLMTFICIYLIKKIKFEFKENKLFRKVNLIIVNITVTVFIISRLPLLYYKIIYFDLGRDEVLEHVGWLLYSNYVSYVFSIALISSVIELAYGNKKYIFIIFFGSLLEITLGARISLFRILFLMIILIRWNFKNILVLITLFIFIGISRSLFSNYSFFSLYDFIILFLGDPLNIFLGNSILINNIPLENCGYDGLHFFRAFIFPLFRSEMDFLFPDVAAICMNKLGLIGYGGSITNDLILAPISVITSFIAFLFIILLILVLIELKYLNHLILIYFILAIVSFYPYILRNGFIATINYLITMFIWCLISLMITVIYYLRRIEDKNNE